RRRTAVPHPFPGLDDDRLRGTDIKLGILQFDVQASPEDDRVFIEFRRLPRLTPPRWAFHAGNAHGRCAGIYPPDEFLDGLGRLSRRFDRSWFLDERS